MSRRPDTEPCMARGNARCEAWGKELAGRNASEGIELRKMIIMEADCVRIQEGRMTTVAKARPASLHRGRRPRHGNKSEVAGTWEARSQTGHL